MKPRYTLCVTTILAVFLLLCNNTGQAQNGNQAEKLMKALTKNDLPNSLNLVQNIDSINYCDKENHSLLMADSWRGFEEVCKILLDKGAKADIWANDGMIALNIDAENGHTEVIKLLLGKGANKELKSKEGKTDYDQAKIMIS